MLSAPTLSRLASLAAFLNTAPGLRGGQPADERFTAATQLPSLVPELQEDEVRLRLAAAAAVRGRELRGRLAEVWALAAGDEAAAVERVNALLAAAGPLRLTAGGDVVGLAPAQVPADAVERLAAMAALALAETAMDGELTRLRVCEGEDCENALVDASRNRSKRFCDEANCANRTHVRAYLDRQAAGEAPTSTATTPSAAPATTDPAPSSGAAKDSGESPSSGISKKIRKLSARLQDPELSKKDRQKVVKKFKKLRKQLKGSADVELLERLAPDVKK